MGRKGILMPISSLPTEFGIGSLGKDAYEFVDFLAENGQDCWQVLPEGPTSFGDSPYQSFSAFGFNHYFIDLEVLYEKGWLTWAELETERAHNVPGTIDYEYLFNTRYNLLKKAVYRRKHEIDSSAGIKNKKECMDTAFAKFEEEQKEWLLDYGLFMAIKNDNSNLPFWEWPLGLKRRDGKAIMDAKERLENEVYCWKVLQFWFYEQHCKLKEYANKKRIKLIGDIPIYVSCDSVELWTKGEMFNKDKDGNLSVVAGCPPDGYSIKGQLWGNPIYDWDYMKKTNYSWWIKRLKHQFSMYDAVRIDHFRGFASYYAIPMGDKDATGGCWKKGPGKDFISAIKDMLPNASIIAEDLGFMTEDVKELLAFSGFPGMKVLQFAFETDEDNVYLPHNYEKNSVVYTGTHDNPTTKEWEETLPKKQLEFARNYLGLRADSKEEVNGDKEEGSTGLTKALIKAAYESPSIIAIIPIQDLLGIGKEGRINTPGTIGCNWKWRVEKSLQIMLPFIEDF